MEAPRTYRKGDSLQSLVRDEPPNSVVERLIELRKAVDNLPSDAYTRTILERALSDLLDAEQRSPSTFWLRPHVLGEIERLHDSQLGHYLFHRYRYDVFPVTKELDDFPPCVQIEPTSICNLRCVFCFQTDPLLTKPKEGHQGQMPLDRFKKIVDQIEGHVEFVTLASRGEPLLAKSIESMLSYLKGKFLGLKINTNATFLSDDKARAILDADPNTVVFSADAADAATYAQLRVNGNFEKVMANIQRFMEIRDTEFPRSKVITRVSGVAFDSNRQDHDEIQGFWRDFVDQVAFVDYNPWENAYEQDANGIEEPCSDLWRRTFIWWDGRSNPCDVDYRSFLSPGNIDEASIAELWRGPGYSHLRHQHLSRQRQGLTPCRGCVAV